MADGTNDTAFEAALPDGGELGAAIWETSPDLMLVIDFDGIFRRTNPAWTVMLGYAEDEIVGRHVNEFVLPDDHDKTIQAYEFAASGGRPSVVNRYRHKDGSARWISWVAAPAGGLTYATGRNITEQRQQEAELAERTAERDRAWNLSRDLQAVVDSDGRFVSANPAWETVLGYSVDELIGRHVLDFLAPDEGATTADAIALALREKLPYFENRYFHKNGDIHTISWVSAPFDGMLYASGRDVTSEKTQARALADSNAERSRLWQLSQDMLARADYSGMMSAVSPAWTHILGWSESELLARSYDTFMHPDDMPNTLVAIGQMAETRKPARFENRIATSDGDWKYIEWTVAPENDGLNFVAVGRDLSLAKSREAELDAARDALRHSQKMEAMGSLTGGVAHDFNNLLTPIIGSLDMLVRRGVGSERERRLIDGAMQSADRAKTLVQRLLAFARRQPLQPSAVDVKRLIEGMEGLIGSTLGPTIDVRIDLAPGLPAAKADANQLEMALLNLAVNARDAMPDGGRLSISANCKSIVGKHGSGAGPGHYVRLSVSDSGTGMDRATLDRAVEPFFSTKGIGKGTGLGLSMVHGLAAQLGGGLSIKSMPDQGTSVELWLPVSATEADMNEDATPTPSHRTACGVALLVDDEDLVRMSTADMLIDIGFEVIEVSSAEEALKLLRAGSVPDLLVTDHLMPGMTGAELAREARAITPSLPVLLVSGYSEVEGIAPDLPRLVKPFKNADLAASIGAMITLTGA